jgi:hypothetical protein
LPRCRVYSHHLPNFLARNLSSVPWAQN